MDKVIGIDLGTTNSVMAVMEGNKPVVIPNAEGERLTPSVVAYDFHSRKVLVGTPAKRQAILNPTNTIHSVKRLAGMKVNAPPIQHEIQSAPYKVRADQNGNIQIALGNEWLSTQEVLAMILQKLKRDAEAYLNASVNQAVITVPAYFNAIQRRAIVDSCILTGLDILRVINEPTAACLAYGLNREREKKVAVYHLGGGTFDISILEACDGFFKVLSTCGDTHLGGDDWNQRLIDYVCDEFKNKSGNNLRKNHQAMQRLGEACERAKIELSSQMVTEINLPYITHEASGLKNLEVELTRSVLEKLTSDLLKRTFIPCENAVKDAGLKKTDVNEIVLIGQQVHMPAIREAVRMFFGKEPCFGVNPAEGVALGAALQGGVLAGEVKDVLLIDVIPLSLSVESLGGVATHLISRNTTIPTLWKETFSTATDNQTNVVIKVFQGERPMAVDNILLGQFQLDGILPALKGTPQIEVTFDIDVNGLLSVTAQDKATGRTQKVKKLFQ